MNVMTDYPRFYTLDYDVRHRYDAGTKVYVDDGKFTPINHGGTEHVAVVINPPKEGAPDMELVLTAGAWDYGKFQRHKLLQEILQQRNSISDRPGDKPARIVVLSRENMSIVLEHCTDVFDPSTREGESHEGLLYGLLVFWSEACDDVRVY